MTGRKMIGVTGGLATGKTMVSDMFVSMGAVKIDADEIAHRLLRDDEKIKRQVTEIFGKDILVGSQIDRRKLAVKVFFNKEKLDRLCRIMHPEIIRCIREQAGHSGEMVVVLDAPLLIEARLNDLVDIVVVVTAGYRTQIKRARDRGISEEEAGNIIDNQMSLSEKIKFADHVIDGENDINVVKEGVREIWQKM